MFGDEGAICVPEVAFQVSFGVPVAKSSDYDVDENSSGTILSMFVFFLVAKKIVVPISSIRLIQALLKWG